MHFVEFPCMKSTTLITVSAPCQLLRWIYNSYGRNFIHECMLCPLVYLFLMQIIISSMQLLILFELLLLLLYSFLCSRMIFLSCRQLIASFSKVAFIKSGSSRVCNFVPPLCCQQPSSCIHHMRVCCLLLLLMVLLIVMLIIVMLVPSYLYVLVYEQLDVFIGMKAHRHLLGCHLRCALNNIL